MKTFQANVSDEAVKFVELVVKNFPPEQIPALITQLAIVQITLATRLAECNSTKETTPEKKQGEGS